MANPQNLLTARLKFPLSLSSFPNLRAQPQAQTARDVPLPWEAGGRRHRQRVHSLSPSHENFTFN